MSTLIYKRLFEVRVLQDYYLAEEASGNSFFGMNEADQRARLDALLRVKQYNIWKDLRFDMTADTEKTFLGHRMKFLQTAIGFVVALEVRKEIAVDGTNYYLPVIPFDDDLRISFTTVTASSLFTNFSNLPLARRALGTRYFFSNETAQRIGTHNVLSSPIPAFDAADNYEMGDLVKVGNTTGEIYFRLDDNAPMRASVEGDGFLHRGDKILLSKKFRYQFPEPQNGNARFRLLALDGSEIKIIQVNPTGAFSLVSLDFSTRIDSSSKDSIPIPDGRYRLEVNLNGSLIEDRQLTLYDAADRPNMLGLLEFRSRTSTPEFNLLDDEGRLITRVSPQGDKQLHPIFELRVLSRRSFWRYRKEGGFKAGDEDISDELKLQGDKLVLEQPKAFTRSLCVLPTNSGIHMPNPDPRAVQLENNRLFSDVYISAINQFQ